MSCASKQCEEAIQKLNECFHSPCDDCPVRTPREVECDGSTLCNAECINSASCESITDAFSGLPTMVSQEFVACTTACAEK